MRNIRIEEVGDINSDYPYLEVFLKENTRPFLEIAISDDKHLIFKLYTSKTDIQLSVEEWSFILSIANDFLPKALKNEDDFLNLSDH
ncbi:MAG: hypothetical protein E2604_10135 [Flavobacterium sp.]|nr:hypothetical protein [Flavobacterium sp.]